MSIVIPENLNALTKYFIIILGSPRSGTSWLNNIINEHPDVAGMQYELRTFNLYIKPLVQAWRDEKYGIEQGHFKLGHPQIWEENEFDDFVLKFLDYTYSKVLNENPKATHILDKHPGYSFAIEEIIYYFPHAKIIHLIRDGRDVVPSMISAKERIDFGPGTVPGAIKLWKNSVITCQQAKFKYPNNILEVKYEELKGLAEDLLPQIFKFCELNYDDKMIDELIENNRYDKKVFSRPNPNFEELRKKGTPVWKKQLSVWERYQIQLAAGDLLQKLGYIENDNWYYDSLKEKIVLIFKKLSYKLKLYFLLMIRKK